MSQYRFSKVLFGAVFLFFLQFLVVGQVVADGNESPVNRPPSANAGTDQTVAGGATVSLNGSESKDPDGDSLIYSWIKTNGTGGTLTRANSKITTFEAPAATSSAQSFTFQLTVTEVGTTGLTDSDTVVITVEAAANVAPIAKAGADQSVAGGTTVNLTSSGSNDPDGGALTYLWAQTSGTSVGLLGKTKATASFTAPAATATD